MVTSKTARERNTSPLASVGGGQFRRSDAAHGLTWYLLRLLVLLLKSEMACQLALPSKSALVQSCLIPERKFNAIAHTHLVVDDAEIVSNDMLTYSQLARYFPIL